LVINGTPLALLSVSFDSSPPGATVTANVTPFSEVLLKYEQTGVPFDAHIYVSSAGQGTDTLLASAVRDYRLVLRRQRQRDYLLLRGDRRQRRRGGPGVERGVSRHPGPDPAGDHLQLGATEPGVLRRELQPRRYRRGIG